MGELEVELTPETYAKVEVELLKATLASAEVKVESTKYFVTYMFLLTVHTLYMCIIAGGCSHSTDEKSVQWG